MYCIDDEGSPYELNEKPYAMPAKVILEDNERPEEILDSLDTHFQNLVDEFATQELSRYYSRENRYEEGIPKPTFPIVMHDVSHSTKPRSMVLLADGRRAVLLDANRIQTLCGIQEIMTLEQARQMAPRTAHTRVCSRCQGKHLQEPMTTSKATSSSTQSMPCGKCRADLRSSAYWDGPDTLVCIPCGTRVHRPIANLSQEETEANESAISQALLIESDEPGHEEGDESELLEEIGEHPETDQESFLEESLGESSDQLCQFEDSVTIETLPETTPLNQAELEEIHAILAAPSARFTGTQSPLVQELLILAERRAVDPNNELEFQTILAQVVSEEIGQLGDLIHAPACHLFKSSKSPLRQTLIDRAIQNVDCAERRMAVWAAAGRLLQNTTINWLRDFHADIDPRLIPNGKKERTAYWTQLRQRRKDEVQPILDWLEQLDREDLALLAGDPDAPHPFVHHPDPGVFQDTTTLLTPLIQYLANELRRFRQQSSGCQLLAGDYGLAVSTLEVIAQQYNSRVPQASHHAAPHASMSHA